MRYLGKVLSRHISWTRNNLRNRWQLIETVKKWSSVGSKFIKVGSSVSLPMQYVMWYAVAEIHPDRHWGFSVICNFIRKNVILCIAVTMATRCNFLLSARLVPGHKHHCINELVVCYYCFQHGWYLGPSIIASTNLLFAINLQIVTLKCVRKLPKHRKYLDNYLTMAAILYLHNWQQSNKEYLIK